MEKDILSLIADTQKNTGQRIEAEIIQFYEDRHVQKRVKACCIVIDKLMDEQAKLKKLTADQVSLDPNGQVVSETFSKVRFQEKQKSEKVIEKYQRALHKALKDGDFSDVLNIGDGKDQGKSDAGENKE